MSPQAPSNLPFAIPGDSCLSIDPPIVADATIVGSCLENNNSTSTVRFSLMKRKVSSSSVEDEADRNCKKKIRRTLSRCSKSFSSVNALIDGLPSSCLITPPVSPPFRDEESLRREDSLKYQLNCVSESSEETSANRTSDIDQTLIFPNLPNSVSESSSSSRKTLFKRSREDSSLAVTTGTDTNSNDDSNKYGWFVMTDTDEGNVSKAYAAENVYKPSTVGDLAFTAPVGPKKFSEEDEAELAWATAADTVDDVLGDFF